MHPSHKNKDCPVMGCSACRIKDEESRVKKEIIELEKEIENIPNEEFKSFVEDIIKNHGELLKRLED